MQKEQEEEERLLLNAQMRQQTKQNINHTNLTKQMKQIEEANRLKEEKAKNE